MCPLPHGLLTCLCSALCFMRTNSSGCTPWSHLLAAFDWVRPAKVTDMTLEGEEVRVFLPWLSPCPKVKSTVIAPLPLLRCQYYLFPFPICSWSGDSLPWALTLGVSLTLVCLLSFAKLVSSCPISKISI